MGNYIIPSIIGKNQKELDGRISKVNKNFSLLHLDLMDKKFVKNKSLMFNLKLSKKLKYEAHLMLKNPLNWIKKNKNISKFDIIILHSESDNLDKAVKLLKTRKKKVGIAVNPRTKLSKVKDLRFNQLLIMTVNPGKYGSKFLPNMLKKIKEARKVYPKINIEVDGGVNNRTIGKLKRAGANKFVVGSFLQKSGNTKKTLKELKNILNI